MVEERLSQLHRLHAGGAFHAGRGTRSATLPHSSRPDFGAATVAHSDLAQHCRISASLQLTAGCVQCSSRPTLTWFLSYEGAVQPSR